MVVFEDIKFQDIVLIIFFIVIVYLLYRDFSNNNCNNENFDTAYGADCIVSDAAITEAITNLSNVAAQIMNDKDTITLPANVTIPGTLTVNGPNTIVPIGCIMLWYGIIGDNLCPNGDGSNVTGTVNGVPYSYIPANEGIPPGWELCDGAYSTPPPGFSSIKKPDLRSKFIIGASRDYSGPYPQDKNMWGACGLPSYYNNPLTPLSVYSQGGVETNTLQPANLPPHVHDATLRNVARMGIQDVQDDQYYYVGPDDGETFITPSGVGTGNNWNNIMQSTPVNNMPPYHALAYIIRVM